MKDGHAAPGSTPVAGGRMACLWKDNLTAYSAGDIVTFDPEFPWDEAEKDLMAGIDASRPHSARIWNYWLGGKDCYPIDREVGDQIAQMLPDIVTLARADRAFLGRAVRHLVTECGIRQFLDIGTGLPAADNTHEVAQSIAPECRIVYVDNDPLVLAHARALLTSMPPGVTDYINADLREPGKILREAARTLDFGQPVALLLLGILHFVAAGEEAQAVVRWLLAALPAGSYLAVAHATDAVRGEFTREAVAHWNQFGKPPMVLRSPGRSGASSMACSCWSPASCPAHGGAPKRFPGERQTRSTSSAASAGSRGRPMPEQSLDEVRLLSVTEATKILRVSNKTVYRLIDSGTLQACRVGRSYRIYEDSARRLLATPARYEPRTIGNGRADAGAQADAPAWIADAWNQGANVDAIAQAAGLTRTQVRRILQDAGEQL